MSPFKAKSSVSWRLASPLSRCSRLKVVAAVTTAKRLPPRLAQAAVTPALGPLARAAQAQAMAIPALRTTTAVLATLATTMTAPALAAAENNEAGAGGEAGLRPVNPSCVDATGCYSCAPKTNDQFLNQCVAGGCPAHFDNTTLTKLNLVGTL